MELVSVESRAISISYIFCRFIQDSGDIHKAFTNAHSHISGYGHLPVHDFGDAFRGNAYGRGQLVMANLQLVQDFL